MPMPCVIYRWWIADMVDVASISWSILLPTIWRTWAVARVSTTGSSTPFHRYVLGCHNVESGRELLTDRWQPQASYYHSPCPIDYDSQTLVEVCVLPA